MIVTRPEIARQLGRPLVKVRGAGESTKGQLGGEVDLTYSGARWSGAAAFAEAGVMPADIKYASIYDSFTITVLIQLEDLGFCAKGEGGSFVSGGTISPGGALAVNTNGGGLSYNHPGMYGLLLIVEAVRQLRGECAGRQVPDADVALVHGNGGVLSSQVTALLGSESTL